MSTLRMTAPITFISAKVNLSPRAKLHGAHEGSTLPLMCGSALSILSSPRGLSVVPQWMQGLTISAYISAVDRSQASMRSYAFRKNTARPLSVCAYFLFRAAATFLCSGVKSAHRSVRLSLPALTRDTVGEIGPDQLCRDDDADQHADDSPDDGHDRELPDDFVIVGRCFCLHVRVPSLYCSARLSLHRAQNAF